MTTTTPRCKWSDLETAHCAHCGAQPGNTFRLEPALPIRLPAPKVNRTGRTLERPKLPDTWAPAADAGECRCGQPTRDNAYVCDRCQRTFNTLLADLGELDDEITTTMTRQKAAAISGGAPSAVQGLPWHDKAADALRELRANLVQWVKFCTEENVRGAERPTPAPTITDLAAWLTTRVHGLSLLEYGPIAVDEITDRASECHRLVFWKRKARIYLGPCRTPIETEEGDDQEPDMCPGEVYAEEDDPIGYCDLCGQGATVVIRRAELEADLDAYLATAAEIARLATYLGLDAPRDQVRKRVHYWHRNKQLEKRGTDPDGSPMFRYGEVRHMLHRDFTKAAS